MLDKLDMIYDSVVATGKDVTDIRRDLRDHAKEQNDEFTMIRKEVSDIKEDVRVVQERNGYINGFIAMVISGVVAWFVSVFGAKG